MGNAALLLRAAGHEILGADQGVYPPMSTVLEEAGISFSEGYDPVRLEALAPDLVVIGNALSRGNPEIEWLLASRTIPYRSLPELLRETILSDRKNIVISGTHGKTTTTSLAAFLLRANQSDPGFLIGGVPLDPPVGTNLGSADAPFVIEGDEYDSAFFDKRSKFIHYAPHVAVLNNLEFDHADIFRDLDDVKRTFSHFLRVVPGNGYVVWNADDENLASLLPVEWTQDIAVSAESGRDAVARIDNFREGPEGSKFRLIWKGETWAEISWSLSGIYNARNAAMAAIAAGLTLYPDDPTKLDVSRLSEFRGVKRRQEIHVERNDLVLIEDFGHHPTAIGQTIESIRARYPGRNITAAFEPRSNTARTNVLQDRFQDALGQADVVLLGAVSRAASLDDDLRFDTVAVAAGLRKDGCDASACSSSDEVLERLIAGGKGSAAPRVVVFFSNGSFDGIIQRFTEATR